jgi:hypothetical protein
MRRKKRRKFKTKIKTQNKIHNNNSFNFLKNKEIKVKMYKRQIKIKINNLKYIS